MLYRKIELELIVVEDDAERVVEELNATLDRLEGEHTIFGGEIETVAVEEPVKQRRSALMHTKAGVETAVDAVKAAGEKVVDAFRKVI
ncbi:MAG TPA: hypothetical protein VH117_00355 [Edaphobacter sp.]|jgi:hypothetical protein|nr:hypothetical protein [Edaphobacter sp.]